MVSLPQRSAELLAGLSGTLRFIDVFQHVIAHTIGTTACSRGLRHRLRDRHHDRHRIATATGSSAAAVSLNQPQQHSADFIGILSGLAAISATPRFTGFIAAIVSGVSSLSAPSPRTIATGIATGNYPAIGCSALLHAAHGHRPAARPAPLPHRLAAPRLLPPRFPGHLLAPLRSGFAPWDKTEPERNLFLAGLHLQCSAGFFADFSGIPVIRPTSRPHLPPYTSIDVSSGVFIRHLVGFSCLGFIFHMESTQAIQSPPFLLILRPLPTCFHVRTQGGV